MKDYEDGHIGATDEELILLLRRCAAMLGVDYVPETPTLSEDALMLKELRENIKEPNP